MAPPMQCAWKASPEKYGLVFICQPGCVPGRSPTRVGPGNSEKTQGDEMASSYAVRMQGIARKYCLASICQPECLPGRSPTRVGTDKSKT